MFRWRLGLCGGDGPRPAVPSGRNRRGGACPFPGIRRAGGGSSRRDVVTYKSQERIGPQMHADSRRYFGSLTAAVRAVYSISNPNQSASEPKTYEARRSRALTRNRHRYLRASACICGKIMNSCRARQTSRGSPRTAGHEANGASRFQTSRAARGMFAKARLTRIIRTPAFPTVMAGPCAGHLLQHRGVIDGRHKARHDGKAC